MGRVCMPLYVLDRNESFTLVFSVFQVPSRWGHPFRVEYAYFIRPRSDQSNFLGVSLWRHNCSPSSFGQCWDSCANINHSGNVY